MGGPGSRHLGGLALLAVLSSGCSGGAKRATSPASSTSAPAEQTSTTASLPKGKIVFTSNRDDPGAGHLEI